MTARVVTAGGSEIPSESMPSWCQMWADGDRRLRCQEISVNVFGRAQRPEPGQLWERVRELGDRK